MGHIYNVAFNVRECTERDERERGQRERAERRARGEITRREIFHDMWGWKSGTCSRTDWDVSQHKLAYGGHLGG